MSGTRRRWTLLATLVFALGLLALVSAPRPKAGSDTCGGKQVTILGTGGDDVIRGTSGPDVIDGLGGNDRIYGYGGDDTLCGGDGDDLIDGGSGQNFIDGGPGTNSCTEEAVEQNCDPNHRIQRSPDPPWARPH